MFFPFDVPFVVQRVFSQLTPDLFVMVETELWPNVLAEAHRRGVKVAMVNARLAGRSWSIGRFLKPLYAWMLSAVDIICAQSKVDADRFLKLGADERSITIAGNSKFDQNFPDAGDARAAKWRSDFGFGLDDPLLLAGSTHPGEEEQILEVYQALRVEILGLQLIIAPRHPERGDAIETLIREHGYEVVRRTRIVAGEQSPPSVADSAIARVGLLDTLGELASLYTAADVVFVGGSLANIGGHDILQPLAQGKPVVFGPHTHKSRDTTELALRDAVAHQVRNTDELLLHIHEVLSDDQLRERMVHAGPEWINTYAGASVKCATALSELIEGAGADGEL
jgi:3-deoxy-D-manno-octulosonic-acid transferase